MEMKLETRINRFQTRFHARLKYTINQASQQQIKLSSQQQIKCVTMAKNTAKGQIDWKLYSCNALCKISKEKVSKLIDFRFQINKMSKNNFHFMGHRRISKTLSHLHSHLHRWPIEWLLLLCAIFSDISSLDCDVSVAPLPMSNVTIQMLTADKILPKCTKNNQLTS